MRYSTDESGYINLDDLDLRLHIEEQLAKDALEPREAAFLEGYFQEPN